MVKGPEFTAYRNRTQSPSSVACRIPCMPYALGKFCADFHVDSAFGWQTQNCFRPLLPISLLMPSQQAIQWPLFAFNAYGARAQHTHTAHSTQSKMSSVVHDLVGMNFWQKPTVLCVLLLLRFSSVFLSFGWSLVFRPKMDQWCVERCYLRI